MPMYEHKSWERECRSTSHGRFNKYALQTNLGAQVMGDSISMHSTLLIKEERIQRLRLIKVVPQLHLPFWFHRNTAQKRNKQLITK